MARSFLDTSALLKYYHAESGTPAVRSLITEPAAELLISRLAAVEILSAFAIKVRTGILTPADYIQLRGLFLADVKRRLFNPIRLLNADYQFASDLVGSHGLLRQLRTLDSLQLAVALRLHRTAPVDAFVCADQRLCQVATLEGLPVTNPDSL